MFISYALSDRPFAMTLDEGLEKAEFDVWMDTDGVDYSPDWRERILPVVTARDAMVCVVSEAYLGSPNCALELSHAAILGKRLIPVILRPVAALPDALRQSTRIEIVPDAAARGADITAAVEAVARAVMINLEDAQLHTQLTVRALDWQHGQVGYLPARQLRIARAWLARASAPTSLPRPTDLIRTYVGESVRALRRARITRALAATVALAVVGWGASRIVRSRAEVRALGVDSWATQAVGLMQRRPDQAALLAAYASANHDGPASRRALLAALVDEPELERYLAAPPARVDQSLDEKDMIVFVSRDPQSGAIVTGSAARLSLWADGGPRRDRRLAGKIAVYAADAVRRRVAIGGESSTISIVDWRPDDSALPVELPASSARDPVAALAWVDDRLAWARGHEIGLAKIDGHSLVLLGRVTAKDRVNDLQWSAPANRLVAGTSGGLESFVVEPSGALHASSAASRAWGSDRLHCAAGVSLCGTASDDVVDLYDPADLSRPPRQIMSPGAKHVVVALSADGSVLAASREDGSIDLFQQTGDPSSGHWAMDRTLRGHLAFASDMEFSSDDRLVSASLDGSVILWRVRGYPSLAHRRGNERVAYMRMSQSGLALLVSSQGSSMVDLAAERDSPCKPSLTVARTEDLAISADGKFAIAARSRTEPAPAGGTEFGLWDLAGCKQRASVSVPLFTTVGAMNFVSDSEIIVQGRKADQQNYPIQYNDGWLKLTTGSSAAELRWEPFSSRVPEGVGWIAWNPGSWLTVVKLSGSRDTIRVRDLQHGAWVGDGFDRDKADGVGITESGDRLGWSDGLGALVVTSLLDTQYRRCVPFASVDPDKELRTRAIRFSRDGQWVFAAMGDDGVVVCDAPSGQFLGRLRRIGGPSGMDDVYFYDPTSLLVTPTSEELVVWDLRPETMRRLACDRAHRNLSMSEWKELLGAEPYHCVCPEFPPGEGADARAPGCAGSTR